MVRILTLVAAFAMCMAAASIDGQWAGEVQPGKKAANPQKVTFTLNLKSQGDTLTGSVTPNNPKGKARAINIQEGKLTGDSFRFVTVQTSKKGENKIVWSGTVKGDEITGSRGRDGARRAPSFTAKRKS